ncbi:hypothetical protein LSAT2_031727 [Lamellibrachia satsuma]|nr:hypothetical protein LSAT2_031727 [Lamellibrachia satsuma]
MSANSDSRQLRYLRPHAHGSDSVTHRSVAFSGIDHKLARISAEYVVFTHRKQKVFVAAGAGTGCRKPWRIRRSMERQRRGDYLILSSE